MFQKFHGLQMRMEFVDNSQLFTKHVFHDVTHGHIVGQPDFISYTYEFPTTARPRKEEARVN